MEMEKEPDTKELVTRTRNTGVRTEEEKQAAAKVEYEKLLNTRSGGTYIPPARLRALQSQITDKSSKEYQRMAWEALKKSINGLINKVNVSNIKFIVPELFGENLVRGRGLFCRSIMKAQAASLPFTPIYAAMTAIVNTKLPQVGELLLTRLIVQFRKAFKRNDKAVCLSSTTFIAQLCNQQVAHEMVAAQILLLLLHKPTDDSVEIAVGLMREVGQHLEEMSGPIALAVFDQFRSILHEADIDKRVQYMIEVLFQVRKDKYKDNPAIREELDLVEEEEQITHRISLEDDSEVQDGLNIFKSDPQWEEHEEAYKRLKAEILGEGSDDEDDSDEEDESEDDEERQEEKALEIKDASNADLVELRKRIYLTIQNSATPESCCHVLMKIQLPAGLEMELPSMIIETCAQRPTYEKFYGLVGERLAKINRLWTDLFEQSFTKYYDTIHRYETNRLRSIARFFGHLLNSDAIGWHVLSVVHLNEEETTSSSRIFIKILFQDLAEAMGMTKLQARLKDDSYAASFLGIFPRDNPRNTRFSINYFTSIGMGTVTEDMREFLQNMPKAALPAPVKDDDESSVSSYSSYSSYSSRSRSPSPRRARRASDSRSPSPRGRRRSYSDSRSRSRSYTPHSRSRSPRRARRGRTLSRTPSRSVTPPKRRGRSLSRSLPRSVSPPRRRSRSYSRSPSGSASPPPRRRGRDSASRSPSPARKRARSISRSPSRAHSSAPRRGTRDVSPPRKRAKPEDVDHYSPPRSGRGRARSHTRGRSPSRRRDSVSRSPSPLPKRDRSLSPVPKRERSLTRRVSPAPRRRNSRSPLLLPRRRDSRSPPRDDHYRPRRVSRSISPMRSAKGDHYRPRRDNRSGSPPPKRRYKDRNPRNGRLSRSPRPETGPKHSYRPGRADKSVSPGAPKVKGRGANRADARDERERSLSPYSKRVAASRR